MTGRVAEIADDIVRRIKSGEWPVLPTIVEMAVGYRCSGSTLTKVLRRLRDQGVVVKNEARRGPPRWVIATPDVPTVSGYALVIADQIASRIEAGEWSELPTIERLSGLCDTSLQTVVDALHELGCRGVVANDRTAPGPGRWVIVDSTRPLPRSRAETIAADIHDRVACGEWDEIPKVRELRQMFPAHAITVQQALRLLAAEGVIVASRGVGGRWVLADRPAPDQPQCRRTRCVRSPIGRGLCVRHYGLWQAGDDPLDLPGDKTPDPGAVSWTGSPLG